MAKEGFIGKRRKMGWQRQQKPVDPVRIRDQVRELTAGRGVEVAIEASGNPRAFELGFELLRKGGRLIVVGYYPPTAVLTLKAAGFHRHGKTIRSSFYGSIDPRRDLRHLADQYLAGELELDSLILERTGLGDINRALDAFHDKSRPNTGRWVIEM